MTLLPKLKNGKVKTKRLSKGIVQYVGWFSGISFEPFQIRNYLWSCRWHDHQQWDESRGFLGRGTFTRHSFARRTSFHWQCTHLVISRPSPQFQVDNFEISVPKEMSALIVEKQTMQFVVPGKIIHLSMANGLRMFILTSHIYRVLSWGSLRPSTHFLAVYYSTHPWHRRSQDGQSHQGTSNFKEQISADSSVCTPSLAGERLIDFYIYADRVFVIQIRNNGRNVLSVIARWPGRISRRASRPELSCRTIAGSICNDTLSLISHRACGKVVCTLCAPKSDLVPTEGFWIQKTWNIFDLIQELENTKHCRISASRFHL